MTGQLYGRLSASWECAGCRRLVTVVEVRGPMVGGEVVVVWPCPTCGLERTVRSLDCGAVSYYEHQHQGGGWVSHTDSVQVAAQEWHPVHRDLRAVARGQAGGIALALASGVGAVVLAAQGAPLWAALLLPVFVFSCYLVVRP